MAFLLIIWPFFQQRKIHTAIQKVERQEKILIFKTRAKISLKSSNKLNFSQNENCFGNSILVGKTRFLAQKFKYV